jgi:hypothetical protein
MVAGQTDIWLYDGTGSARVRFVMAAVPGARLLPGLRLLDGDENILGSAEGRPTASIETRLPATATYKLIATGADNSTGAYRISVTVIDAPALEPVPQLDATSTLLPPTPTPEGTAVATFIASDPQAGRPIVPGETIEGELALGRWDIWEFEAEAGQHVTIRLRSSAFDPYLELYGPSDDRTPLYDDDSGRGRNAALYDIVLEESGTYRIYARSYENQGAGAYRLSLQVGTGLMPDKDTSLPIHYNEVVMGTLQTEELLYYFEGRAGDEIAVLLSSATLDTYLELVDSNGRILDENDDNGRDTNSAIIHFELPNDGTYFIVVASYILDASGDYELELLHTGPGIEPTNGEIKSGETVTARLLPDSTAEWVFRGAVGAVISVSAMPANPDEAFDLVLEMIGPDGASVLDDDSGFANNPALTDIRLSHTGLYTLRVHEYKPTIGGYYRLALADGRAYFAPTGEAARIVPAGAPGEMTVFTDVLDTASHAYSLWIVIVPEGQLLTVELVTGNGGEGLPQDFRIQIMDTSWNGVAESADGEVLTERVASTTDMLVLIHYLGPGTQPYQIRFITGYRPASMPVNAVIIGTLEVDVPVTRMLPAGERQAWRFTAPHSGSYRIVLAKGDDSGSYDPYLYVLDADGEQLAQDDDSGGGVNPAVTLILEAEQTITIVAAGFGDLTGGDYTLVVMQEQAN